MSNDLYNYDPTASFFYSMSDPSDPSDYNQTLSEDNFSYSKTLDFSVEDFNKVFPEPDYSQSTNFNSDFLQENNQHEKEMVVELNFNEEENKTETVTNETNINLMTPSPSYIPSSSTCASSVNIIDRYEEIRQNILTREITTPSDRKLQDDSIRKKIKTHTEENIKNVLNLHYSKVSSGDKKIILKKLPQNFLSNVTIDLNKEALLMTVEERYQYDYGDESSTKLDVNRKVVNIMKHKYYEREEGVPLMKMKVKDLMTDYFNSKKYESELRKIEEKEGLKYAKKFDLLVKGNGNDIMGYVEYYLKTPGNSKSKNK